jgi:Ca2+-binding EF-hand superfamily protein
MKQHKISNEDLFKDIDENNDKSVTLAELENKLKSYDYFTKKEILAIHGYFDKNNDEVIDFKEFNS